MLTVKTERARSIVYSRYEGPLGLDFAAASLHCSGVKFVTDALLLAGAKRLFITVFPIFSSYILISVVLFITLRCRNIFNIRFAPLVPAYY